MSPNINLHIHLALEEVKWHKLLSTLMHVADNKKGAKVNRSTCTADNYRVSATVWRVNYRAYASYRIINNYTGNSSINETLFIYFSPSPVETILTHVAPVNFFTFPQTSPRAPPKAIALSVLFLLSSAAPRMAFQLSALFNWAEGMAAMKKKKKKWPSVEYSSVGGEEFTDVTFYYGMIFANWGQR